MEQEDIETYKYRAESLKQIGVALCSPLAMVIVQILLRLQKIGNLLVYMEFYIACIMFILGSIFINRSIEIMNLRGKS